jgi:hypothetical protein
MGIVAISVQVRGQTIRILGLATGSATVPECLGLTVMVSGPLRPLQDVELEPGN